VRNQTTLRGPVTFRGTGLHFGREVTTVVKPAEPDTGVVFVRTDLPGQPKIPMRGESALKRDRRTAITNGEAEVETVEHLAAGLWMLAIDNVTVEIDGPELPALDGSALPFAEGLRDAGRVEQKALRKVFALDQPVAVSEGEASLTAFPYEGGLKISYTLDYGNQPALKPQFVSLEMNEDRFLSQIAPARTFCLEAEAKLLQDSGFGLGATTRNTLVIGDNGLIDNVYRLENEPARHKVLDLIGDLAMLSADLKAHIVATRTGHKTNVELVNRLSSRQKILENQGMLSSDTALDIKEIMKIIPHRYPFLFIDRVISLEGYQRAVAIKNVSINEPFFEGHWPGQPILPGVVQIEALAQLAGVLLLRRLLNTAKVAVLLSIDRIKFRKAVTPGDQLRLECETQSIRAKSAKVLGRASVNNDLTCEAVMKFMLMDA
jgi:UDP-3-O-[3-hydroxymyristoyl] N-acetylglucosamine deacetylase/3-hydroxyacyl-[acyl-carrier-protein] dehydratase